MPIIVVAVPVIQVIAYILFVIPWMVYVVLMAANGEIIVETAGISDDDGAIQVQYKSFT
jgi:uncharacterized membrane protein YdbT with pleckstrin-like domain